MDPSPWEAKGMTSLLMFPTFYSTCMPVYRVPVKEFVTQVVLEHTTAANQERLFPAVCLRVRNPTAL